MRHYRPTRELLQTIAGLRPTIAWHAEGQQTITAGDSWLTLRQPGRPVFRLSGRAAMTELHDLLVRMLNTRNSPEAKHRDRTRVINGQDVHVSTTKWQLQLGDRTCTPCSVELMIELRDWLGIATRAWELWKPDRRGHYYPVCAAGRGDDIQIQVLASSDGFRSAELSMDQASARELLRALLAAAVHPGGERLVISPGTRATVQIEIAPEAQGLRTRVTLMTEGRCYLCDCSKLELLLLAAELETLLSGGAP